MTETLISLLSIFIGILGANGLAYFNKKYSMGLTGNTIAGIFGSIFFIKFFGRIGFDPVSIMETGHADFLLLIINLLISFLGGTLGLVGIHFIKNKLKQKK
ncbi:MAG: hypothetical protein ACTH3E_00400 [Psychroflexus halocasei]